MAGEIKQFKDVNNNTHKVDITGVEGLQSALDGKLSFDNRAISQALNLDALLPNVNNNILIRLVWNNQTATTVSDMFTTTGLSKWLLGVNGDEIVNYGAIYEFHIIRFSDGYQILNLKQAAKVTSISQSSTHDQYPSALSTYALVAAPIQVTINEDTTIDVTDSNFILGRLYYLYNVGANKKRLNQILTGPEGTKIRYHQDAATINKNAIFIRVYHFASVDESEYYFCEIVGAFDILG